MHVPAEIQQRLGFIDRTIFHAVRACRNDDKVPHDLRTCIEKLSQRASEARQALQQRDEHEVCELLDELARVSDEAQGRIHPADDMNFDVRSAVILTHIEVSALRSQLRGPLHSELN